MGVIEYYEPFVALTTQSQDTIQVMTVDGYPLSAMVGIGMLSAGIGIIVSLGVISIISFFRRM